MCGESNVTVAFTCENGHTTCIQCADVGIDSCHHHFCTDSEIYFEPGETIEINREELETLRERANRLIPVPSPPRPWRMEPTRPVQVWTPVPRQQPYHQGWGDGSTSNITYPVWTASDNTSL